GTQRRRPENRQEAGKRRQSRPYQIFRILQDRQRPPLIGREGQDRAREPVGNVSAEWWAARRSDVPSHGLLRRLPPLRSGSHRCCWGLPLLGEGADAVFLQYRRQDRLGLCIAGTVDRFRLSAVSLRTAGRPGAPLSSRRAELA